MDLPEPQGAEALLAAMEAAHEHFDADVERRLLDVLARAELLVPLVTDEATGRTVAARLGADDGTQSLVAFTHADAVRAFHPDEDVSVGLVGAPDLAATAIPADGGLVINPAGPHAGQLDRRALESLAATGVGRTPAEEVEPGDGFEIRAPAEPLDPELAEALQTAVTTAPTLREAWYAEVTGAGPDHGILVLVGDGEEPPDAIADLLSAELGDGAVMDLLPVEAASWDAGDYAQVKDVATLV